MVKDRGYDVRETLDIVVEILKQTYSGKLVWDQPKKSTII